MANDLYVIRDNRSIAKHLGRLNLPIVLIWLGLLFPVNYFLSKALEFSAVYDPVETKESLFGFLSMLVAIHFLQANRTMRAAEVLH